MKMDVFGTKRTTNDGKKTFYSYYGTLKKKDGTEKSVEVKFKEICGNPKNVPCVVEFDKKNANLSKRKYDVVNEDGVTEKREKEVLWISEFKESEYVDNSLDDFE